LSVRCFSEMACRFDAQNKTSRLNNYRYLRLSLGHTFTVAPLSLTGPLMLYFLFKDIPL